MTKEQIIRGATALIRKIAKEKNLSVENKGTGHGFDDSFWNFPDTSEIPTIIAWNDVYKIELRPFWSSPEIDVWRQAPSGEELLIFNFSDFKKINGKYQHTGNWRVHEVRVDARWDYKACINEVYEMIDFVLREASGEGERPND